MKNLHFAGLIAGALIAAASAAPAAVIYTTNFETDQSSAFTVRTTTADTEANFNFDYSTWAPTAPTTDITSIPAAPSGAGTKGLKLRANFDATGTSEGVNAFINASAGMTSYVLTFDAFPLYNGPGGPAPVGGTGTTTCFSFGNAVSTAVANFDSATLTGFIAAFTTEGGSGTDARLYTGNASASTLSSALANWLGAGLIDMSATNAWGTTVFTAPNYPTVGTTGRQWSTWKLEVDGSNVTISVKPFGAASFIQLSSFASTVPTNNTAFFGFFDPFTSSVADPASDNFVVIDNVTLEDIPPPTSAGSNWALYE